MNKRKDPRLHQQMRTEKTARGDEKQGKQKGSQHTEAECLRCLLHASGESAAEGIRAFALYVPAAPGLRLPRLPGDRDGGELPRRRK